MKIEHKIKLIESLLFTPEEISIIDEFTITERIEKNIENDDYDSLIKYLEEIISNETIDDDTRLKVAYFNSKLKRNRMIFGDDDDDYKQDDDDGDFDKNEDYYMYNHSEEERTKQREAIEKFKTISEEELTEMIHNYTWGKFKKIQDGFDRSIYSDAKNKFWSENGIVSKWDTPENLREKIRESENLAQNRLKESFRKVEEEKVEIWTDNYLKWLQKQGINKYTKQNIKQYFKEAAIKVSDTTVEKVKILANN